jgi:hypothetical protein
MITRQHLFLAVLLAGCNDANKDTDAPEETEVTDDTETVDDSEPPPPPDADADTVPDFSDNCPAAANTDQANNDGDLFGDACDDEDDVVFFVKRDFADVEDPSNQDCITPNVCITRGDSQGIFNIAQEDGYGGGVRAVAAGAPITNSPVGVTVQKGFPGEGGSSGGIAAALGGDLSRTPWTPMSWTIDETGEQWQVLFTEWRASSNGGGIQYGRTRIKNFELAEGADLTAPTSQDCWGPRLCLTRDSSGALVNTLAPSLPLPVEIAFGPTVFRAPEDYTSAVDVLAGGPPLSQVLSVHVLGTEVYYDVVFTDWGLDGSAAWNRSRALRAGCTTSGQLGYDAAATIDHGHCGWNFVVKGEEGDPTLARHQACVSANVCLTRGSQRGLYNILSEETYNNEDDSSPAGTFWLPCFTTGAYATDYTTTWNSAMNGNPPEHGRNPLSFYSTADSAYFDVVQLHWAGNGSGGGFALAWREAPDAPNPPTATSFLGGGGAVCSRL